MKTLKQIEKEYTSVFNDFNMKPTVRKRKLEMMRQCKLYIATNPDKDFVVKMKSEQEKKLKNINNGFLTWLENTHNISDPEKKTKKFISKLRREYNNLLGKSKINLRIRTLTYLLSE